MCDEIIQQQRALLEEHNVLYPKDLEELYILYQQEFQDRPSTSDTNLPSIRAPTSKVRTLSQNPVSPFQSITHKVAILFHRIVVATTCNATPQILQNIAKSCTCISMHAQVSFHDCQIIFLRCTLKFLKYFIRPQVLATKFCGNFYGRQLPFVCNLMNYYKIAGDLYIVHVHTLVTMYYCACLVERRQ